MNLKKRITKEPVMTRKGKELNILSTWQALLYKNYSAVRLYSFLNKILFSPVVLLVLFFVLFSGTVSGQSVGDYRTRNGGNWDSNNAWRIRTSGTWNNTNNYPGIDNSLPNIYIRDNVTLNLTPAFHIGSIFFEQNNTITINSSETLYVEGNISNGGANGTISVNGILYVEGNISNVNINGNGTIYVTGDFNPGSFTAGTTTVIYNGSGTQQIGPYTYNHLNLTGAGPFVTQGNITVNGNFSASGIINTTNDITFNGTTSCGGVMNATAGTVTYAGTAASVLEGTYYNITKSGGGTSALCGDVIVSNVLNLNSGIVRLSTYDLTLSNTGTGAITGTYGASNMVETDGTGMLVKEATGTAGFNIVFPIGAGGYYTPMNLSGVTGTVSGSGSISARAVPGFIGATNLKRYWQVVSSNLNATNATITFDYNNAEVNGTQANYDPWFRPQGGTWQAPANPTATGVKPFGSNGISTLSGEWTTGETKPKDIKTYYSYQTGDWNTVSTWTLDPGGTLQTATQVPGDGDRVVILSGRAVSLTADITSINLDVTINSGGVIDMQTYRFTNDLAALRGQGTA